MIQRVGARAESPRSRRLGRDQMCDGRRPGLAWGYNGTAPTLRGLLYVCVEDHVWTVPEGQCNSYFFFAGGEVSVHLEGMLLSFIKGHFREVPSERRVMGQDIIEDIDAWGPSFTQ